MQCRMLTLSHRPDPAVPSLLTFANAWSSLWCFSSAGKGKANEHSVESEEDDDVSMGATDGFAGVVSSSEGGGAAAAATPPAGGGAQSEAELIDGRVLECCSESRTDSYITKELGINKKTLMEVRCRVAAGGSWVYVLIGCVGAMEGVRVRWMRREWCGVPRHHVCACIAVRRVGRWCESAAQGWAREVAALMASVAASTCGARRAAREMRCIQPVKTRRIASRHNTTIPPLPSL
jgi:hypothetical protein